MRRSRRIQQQLPLEEPPEHGGRRRGAGRKPTHPGKRRVRHGARPATDARFPVHVTKRVRGDVARLRGFELCKTLRLAFVLGCRKDVDGAGQFRICQFSIQGNHIHMICEASNATALARGVQGWSVRVARGLNGHLGRIGKVFDDRYHVEVLKNPTQTRNALCYVLLNARRHGVWLDPSLHGMDPFSSSWWFDGWKDPTWKVGLSPPEVRTVAEPTSWLLSVGWRRARTGLIAIDETPAARGTS